VLPDAVSAGFFVIVWRWPFAFGALSVQTAMLTMLLEFFLVHATGFFTVFVNAGDVSRWKKVAALLALSCFYFLMLSAFALAFHAWWPVLAFAWLLAGKLAWVWANPRGDEAATGRQMAAWAGSVALFLGGTALTAMADVPRWGMTAALQPGFGLDMRSAGIWESQPHRVVAFGALYFAVTGVAKLLSLLWGDARLKRGAK
jgi:hypothetical protein